MLRQLQAMQPLGGQASQAVQRRHVVKLYTSYTPGYITMKELTGPRPVVPAATQFRASLRSKYGGASPSRGPAAPLPVTEVDGGATDVVHAREAGVVPSAAGASAAVRPYVPLGDVARIELQGDYLCEGGLAFDALRSYGVVAKAFNAAYPENHNQRAMIRIKLSRAFRLCGMLQSAQENAEAALFMLDHNAAPQLDLVCEAITELGETLHALGSPDAGPVFEDLFNLVDDCHSLGNSERTTRLLPRLGRRQQLNQAEKFLYVSPFDSDRVYLLTNHAASRAEAIYRQHKDQAGVVRVLERQTKLMTTKDFEMRDTSGTLKTVRGRRQRQARYTTNGSTPRELLLYSPTIHQVYIDRSALNIAAIGQEGDVMPGSNRRVLDDGAVMHQVRKTRSPYVGRKVDGLDTSMSTVYDY